MPGSSSTIRMRAPAVVISTDVSMAATLAAARNDVIALLKSRLRQNLVGHPGVGLPLAAEGGHGPVAGHEAHVLAQRPELAGDRVDQLLVVPAREVGAPDRALEQ